MPYKLNFMYKKEKWVEVSLLVVFVALKDVREQI